MKVSSDKILLNRLIYLQIILFVPLMIFLLPLILFPESMPESYFTVLSFITPYLINDAAIDFLSPGLAFFENTIFISAEFILWIACYVFLLQSKKIGVQLLYILIAMEIFYVIYGGDQIYTPLLGSLSYIERIALGMTLYLVTFSSIKNSFK
jgi:hypothetical protein